VTSAQTTILARARTAPNGFSTSWCRLGTGLTTPQAYRVLQQLVSKGLVVREQRSRGVWRPVTPPAPRS
jgi:DNA-binding IclR family transcriptional regulator